MKSIKEFLKEKTQASEKDVVELTRLLSLKGVNVSSSTKGRFSTISLGFLPKDLNKVGVKDSDGKTYIITIQEVKDN